MNTLIYALIAIIIGVGISLQPPINSVMARALNSPILAAAISLFISVNFALLVWLALGKKAGDLSQIKSLPWWVIIGGMIGVLFVGGSIVIIPIIGVALFFVCVVGGQLLGSSVIDQFGLFGLPVKPLNITKMLGLFLVLAGAILVQSSNT
ncbi:MAG: hypothetical protein GKR93_02605 [Gammaproteobacteria bacterium]|nr:hypothetical protein [Gammaproteobacteria bacterium]